MKFRTTLILLVIFIVALGAVLLVENKSKAVKEKKEQEETLTDLKVSDIEKLQLTGSGQMTITVQKDEKGNWQITEPLRVEADSYEVNSLVETLANLRIEHLVDDQPANLDEYGFVQKEVKIWVKGQTEPVSILTGMDNPLDGTLYAKRADQTKVVLLPGYLKSSLDKNLFDLRRKEIIKFDPKEVESIELNSKDLVWKLTRKADNWFLTSPVEALAAASKVESILTDLSTLKAKNFLVEEKKPEDLKAFGLDRPDYLLKLILTDGQELTLSLSKKEDKVQATSSLLSQIAEIDGQIMTDLTTQVSQLREKKIAQFNSWEVTELNIKKGDQSFSAVKEKSGEKEKQEENWYLISPSGQKELAEASKVEAFLRKLEYLEAVDFVDRPEASGKMGLDKPEYEIIIKVKTEDNKEKSIQLLFGQKLEAKNQLAVRNSDFSYLFLIDSGSISGWPAGAEDFKPVAIEN
jgi:hypothetical protein